MANSQILWDTRKELSCIVLVAVFQAIAGQIHYSVPEELQKGSFVGDITKDLGMDLKQLLPDAVQIVTEGRTQYFALNLQNGYLYIKERLDREQLCPRLAPCVLKLEILVQGQLKVYTVDIAIEDINDNTPTFQAETLQLNIPESAAVGCTNTLTPQQAADKPDPLLTTDDLNIFQENLPIVQLNGGQIHYTIPEELQKGSYVGSIAEDLGLSNKELSDSNVRVISEAISGKIHYSIREEMQKGSFVGNIAMDLGMDGNHLSDHGLRIVNSKEKNYCIGPIKHKDPDDVSKKGYSCSITQSITYEKR
ncbi:hypothetical protein JRQ81_010694 [Phrynocephalus forsythii]|uniref:Cadherin domain-containing protein n=1 Tax=Phrynocephalus forsythii TaxID=171643 RepID=A0A9Q0Y1C3_9SAUR|nr:hypothetical protein JRQ81_010694 [Phrynocephalus forsythii]